VKAGLVSMAHPVQERIEELRRRLLDLSRRNRLLNHRPGGGSSLQIVEERPDEVFRLFLREERAMQFLSREEAHPEAEDLIDRIAKGYGAAAAAHDEPSLPATQEARGPALQLAPIAEPAPALRSSEEKIPKERHTDLRLQTVLEGEKLQARLIHLARQARLALEEQGCNVLYLAIGVVEWREPGEREGSARAPLLFLPAELYRQNVRSRHTLRPFDEEPLFNPCLIELCRRFFSFEFPAPEIDDGFDFSSYLKGLEVKLTELPGWKLLPEIHIGLFSFAKYLLYRDLDPALWPEGSGLLDHPHVRRLLGEPPAEPQAPAGEEAAQPLEGGAFDPRSLDASLSPRETYHVLDADSSQLGAILAARQGRSLVIEGPPGTGKSQTIANIIAECLAAKKTVLFVAEKAAALEVVKSRLERVGLADSLLDLHSRATKKRAVVEELQRALERREPPVEDREEDPRGLEESRRRLNEIVEALHGPFGKLCLSPFDAISRAVERRAAPRALCPLPDPLSWAEEELKEATEALEQLRRRLERTGSPRDHPWRGSGLEKVDFELEQRLSEAIRALGEGFSELEKTSSHLAALLGASPPATAAEAVQLAACARSLARAPRIPASLLWVEGWEDRWPSLRAWIERGEERQRCRERWMRFAKPEAETPDWSGVLERRRGAHGSLWRFLSPSWWRDSKRIAAIRSSGTPLTAEGEIALLEDLGASRRLRAAIEAEDAVHRGLLGDRSPDLDGDWSDVRRLVEAVTALRRAAGDGRMAREAIDRYAASEVRPDLDARLAGLEKWLAALPGALGHWLSLARSDESSWLGGSFQDAGLAGQARRLRDLETSFEHLRDWADFRAAEKRCREGRLTLFLDWALGGPSPLAPRDLNDCFLRLFYHAWSDNALQALPALREFRGEDHEALIARFREADSRWLAASRRRLAVLLDTRQPEGDHEAHPESKLGILKLEMRRKRGHMPLRRLFSLAGEVIQSIKPCFLMSPISAAQYLAPGSARFDAVIFDEASQVEPADAIGAIARGRQLLLIGDEKQLPPTSFFQRIESGDDRPVDADSTEPSAADLESILGLGLALFPARDRLTLRWHYRSRHQSLIDFSNARFYEGLLRVFPSSHTGREDLGLAMRIVEGGIYERGTGQHNPAEARRVAEEVLRFARDHPDRSLGVGAFSVAQQRAIEDEVERLRRAAGADSVERFFDRGREEPFFVKNLETIQGDERDVIFLSVGYGRDRDGKLTMNFGPLNQEGGWRRLNVLVTRARLRCVLFSSMRADDIDLSRTQARGVAAFKEYLHFAEHGQMTEEPSRGKYGSGLEASVGQALEEKGWVVHAQVGSAGFALDLAVVDPVRPGRYLLGIECDGATYRNTPTARDRDRLRREVLENLGWRIERVWSADWFRRPEAALARLVKRLEEEKARAGATGESGTGTGTDADTDADADAVADADAEPVAAADAEAAPAPAPAAAPKPASVPYAVTPPRLLGDGDTLRALAAAELASLLDEIVRIESPIHEEEALRRVVSFFNARVSPAVRTAAGAALAILTVGGKVARRGGFLWLAGATEAPVRHRGKGCPAIRPECIAPEEFQAAIRLVLRKEYGLRRDSLAQAALRLLGFRRPGPPLTAAADAAVGALAATGEVEEDAQGFLVPRTAGETQ